ncbi:MAG: outer membrane beta-barrel protein [Chthoniobacterales bacterium]
MPKRFQYAVRLNLRSVYDDNISLTKGNGSSSAADIYFAIEPAVSIGFGDIVGHERNFIRLDYAPSFFVYTEHSGADALQQVMRLEGEYRFSHLSLGLTQDVQLLEGTNPGYVGVATSSTTRPALNLDAGGNVKQNIYSTNASFSYDLTGKTFLSGSAQLAINDYQSLIGSEVYSGNLFLNYTYSPKLVIGLGGTAGYNAVDSPNPSQTFEQINGRLTYELSGKVNLNASGGVEFRQFESDSRGGNYVSPVFELGATYQPFDGTTLNLIGSRRTQNSAVLFGQDYTSTQINLSARQRFLRRLYLGLAIGYEKSDYFSTVQAINASRNDNYFFVQPSIDLTLMRFWTLGVYYLHRQDDSSSEAFSFNDNQVGMRTSLTF